MKGKRVLITAGPTWVPIDPVRVISNTATGETGTLLAQICRRSGANVTLLLGPAAASCPDSKVKVIRFTFFNELRSILFRELASHKYQFLIHAAAVSDYGPQKLSGKKIVSGIKRLDLKLKPTPKLIDAVKKISKGVYLVGFKFEPDAAGGTLIKKARDMMHRSCADIVVANTVRGNRYQAYIVGEEAVEGPIKNKRRLAERLIKRL